MQISSEIALLAQIMMRQRKRNAASFTLLLCSESAPASVEEIEREVLLDSMLPEQIEALNSIRRQKSFSEKWKNLEVEKRYRCIEQAFIEAKKKPQYQPKMESYNGLSKLIEYGYFDTIITTNIDTCLEDALINIGVNRRNWQVLINGRDSLEMISQELKYPTPRIKIIKLYGELNSRKFAFDLQETKEFIGKIKPLIQTYLNGSVLMVGESTIDKEVSSCIPSESDNFYYVNLNEPQDNSKIRDILLELQNHTVISGEQAEFSLFFKILSQKLIDFEQIGELGIDINNKSDEQLLTALQSEKPLVELLEEDDDIDTLTATTTAEESLVNQDLLLDVIEPTTFYIHYDQHLAFAVRGPELNYESSPGGILNKINPEDLNSELMDMGQHLANSYRLQEQGKEGRDFWRRSVQRVGKHLFQDLLADKSNLMQKWGKVQQAVQSEYLNLCFIGPRNYLGMPYELLYDTEPWAVRYPISRCVTDVSTNTQSFGTLVSDLVRNQEPLKVLLIASNTGGISPDIEIKALAEKIQQKADVIRLQVQIELVPTESASIQKVEQLLKKCSYNIVHYAGHSYFDKATGEGSGLIFWEHPGNLGSKQRLTARALSQLLRDSQTILFYLSSCVGAAVGGEHLLRGNDYLGIMDAIVQAGIPTVLGYRWYVTDSGAKQFATTFYESLLETQSPNRAVLYARQDIYRRNAMDETWISPILVDQNL